MAADGEAMGLIPEPLDIVKHRVSPLDHERRFVRHIEMLPPGIAVWSLCDTCDAEIGNAEIGEDASRRIELALPAIDEDEIGPGLRPIGIGLIGGLAFTMFLEQPREPAREH